MLLKEAIRELKRVGTRRATGAAYAAMCAEMLTSIHGGDTVKYYTHLNPFLTDEAVRAEFNRLAADRSKAWDILIGETSNG